jgi:hypothetical protein
MHPTIASYQHLSTPNNTNPTETHNANNPSQAPHAHPPSGSSNPTHPNKTTSRLSFCLSPTPSTPPAPESVSPLYASTARYVPRIDSSPSVHGLDLRGEWWNLFGGACGRLCWRRAWCGFRRWGGLGRWSDSRLRAEEIGRGG